VSDQTARPGAGLLRGGEIWSTRTRRGKLPISRGTFRAGVEKGIFPKPIRLGPGILAWHEEEIDQLAREGTGRIVSAAAQPEPKTNEADQGADRRTAARRAASSDSPPAA
jgi:predicted DNA-binding transcriptional regulator AlpA